MLDRNQNFEVALRPDRGDGVAAPDAVVVVDGDVDVDATIVFTLP